ncbi:hypothetical protein FACS1894211_03170 [Clostridia bacterium]|nr:hypothetical protein FACS1894211_03170 [Clostridia bacterium]
MADNQNGKNDPKEILKQLELQENGVRSSIAAISNDPKKKAQLKNLQGQLANVQKKIANIQQAEKEKAAKTVASPTSAPKSVPQKPAVSAKNANFSISSNTSINMLIGDSDRNKDLVFANFIKAINEKGGEFFEIYSLNLLKKYYKLSNVHIDGSKHNGGSNDGGIDAIIETTDFLGYREKVYIQAKNYSNAAITLTECQQFYGSMCANHGTRGIYVTTSLFHKAAWDYILSVPNLIGIDRQKLYEIAVLCQYGVNTERGRDWIDASVFN